MAGALGNLLIMLTADTGQATSDIGKAAHQVERDMLKMQTTATAAGMLIAEAVGQIAASFARAAKEAVQFGDQLNKMSQRTSFSVERLSEMAFAAELADVSIGTMSTALGMFNKVMSDAQKEGSKTAEVFKAMGVDITQGPQVAFDQFAKAINTLPDGETKVAAMRAVFGRAGDALIPMIKGLDDATEKANKLGLVMSGQMAADAERFNDAMTVLGTTMRSLGLMALEPMVGWLSNVAEGMAKAKADGTLLKNTMLELAKTYVAFWGAINQALGLDGIADMHEKAFRRLQKLQQELRPNGATPGASGSWGEDAAGAAADADAVQRALNNANKKTGAGRTGKKAMSFEELMAKGEAKRQQVYEDSERKLSEIAEREETERQRLHNEGMQAYFKSIDERIEREENAMRLIAGFDEQGKKIKEETQKTDDIAKQLGLTFSSAFEDAIIEGKKFSDVLRGIGQDLLRIAARKLVTEPLAKMGGDIFSSLASAVFGGGKALGGPVDAGTSYLVGERGPEMFVPNTGGTIVPNSSMGGGPTVYADMRGASVDAVQRLEQFMVRINGSIEQRAVSAVNDTRRRGGSFARGM